MKTIKSVGLVGVLLFVALNLLHTQNVVVSGFNRIVAPMQAPPDSFVQVAAESQGLSPVAPVDLPRGATYWWVMANGSAVPAPCLPKDLNAPIYQITDAQFLVDTTGGQVAVNSRRFGLQRQSAANNVANIVAAQTDSVVNLINQIQTREYARQVRAVAMAMGIPSFGGGDGGGGGGGGVLPSGSTWTFDTSGLWLGNPTVSNGVSSVNLNHATNQVYAILTTTNLLGSWQVETVVWPTNNSVMPFTVQNGDRQILFFRAKDWTGVTENGNITPDWWLWQYFGTTALSDTNLDANGNTLLSDYQNGTDPNIIQFTIEAASQYVNTTNINAQLNITAGTPSYYAVLVNGQTTTNWLPLTTVNLPVNLGSTDGVYNVAIGLRGLPANAAQTWDNYSFTLDRVAPKLSLTNPAGGTVIKPYLQLQGFADKPLASLSYDISNGEGVVTNQDAFVTDQSFDTNKFDFTTNYFQAYDVPLATNVNNITLRVTDRAGNTTTTNFNVVLDYSSATNPPVVNLIWPQDGMAVSGTNITIRGTMSDETGTIAVQTVDGNGNTNAVTGLVERNGMFWIENVPLNGTNQNQITLQVTDAAGNVTVTNFTVRPSDLVLTIDSTPTGDALYQGYGSVSGTVSDPNTTVTVNGVTVTNDFWTDGTTWHWEADNVPIYGQGTATFDAVAIPAGQTTYSRQSLGLTRALNSGSPITPPVNASAAVEMGAYVTMTSYHGTETQDYESPDYYSYNRVKKDMSGNPVITPNGQWSLTDNRTNDTYSSDNYDSWSEYDHENYQWSQFTPVTAWEESDSSWGNSYNGPAQWPDYGLEYELVQAIPHEDQTWGCASCGPNYIWACVHHYFADKVQYHWDLGAGSTFDLNLTAKTQVKLFTGGKAQVSRKNLFRINATASEILRPPLNYGIGYPWWSVQSRTMAPTSLTVAGKSPGTDGNLWLVLPDNSPGLDITVKAPRKKHYDANATAQKYHPYISLTTSTTNANLDTDKPEVCVGQNVTFVLSGLPTDQFTNTFGQWYLPTKYVNEAYAYSSTCTSYRINSNLLQNTNQTSCWFVNDNGGSVKVGLYLNFQNGQSVIVTAKGNFTVYRPKVSNTNFISAGTPACDDGETWVLGIHYFGMVELNNIHSHPTGNA